MARNSEKAKSMLHRFREQQSSESGVVSMSGSRPRAISQITSHAACEKWRSQVVAEVTTKIKKINDPTLTDFQIRELNDEINALEREKYRWETHLRDLGGTNYVRAQPDVTDADGRVIASGRGYRYYGRARELPGVKELFTELAAPAPSEDRNKHEFARYKIDERYYGRPPAAGTRDKDEDELLAWEAQKEREQQTGDTAAITAPRIEHPIPVFGQVVAADVEALLLEKHKADLLARYAEV